MQKPKSQDRPLAEHFKLFQRKFKIPNPITEQDAAEYEGAMQTFYSGALAMVAMLDPFNPELKMTEDMRDEIINFAKSQAEDQKPSANEPMHATLNLIDPAKEEADRKKIAELTGFDDLETLNDLIDPNATS